MRTIVATATTDQEATDIYLALYGEHPHVEYANIDGLQVTFIYIPIAEKEAQQEQANREWIEKHSQPKTESKKQRKQPSVRELNTKVEKLYLFHLEVDKNAGVYDIRQLCSGKILFTSKSGISVSRQLTKMYWDKTINHLQNNGLIAR
jgi:hypothetical protein